jgi:glutamyl-tRNA reductase
VLVLGAGEIASDVARQVAKRAFARLTIANRSREKAQLLAGELGAACSPWDTIDEVLERADVVVAATAATEPVLTLRRVADALRQRHGRPLLVIDLGLPRNVDPNVPCELMDVDAIQDSCRVTLARRQRAIGSVETLVEESLSAWTRFSHSQTAERQIKRLYQAAAEASRTAAAEIARLDGLDSREAEKIVLKTIKRLLHEHARDLRGVTTRSGA